MHYKAAHIILKFMRKKFRRRRIEKTNSLGLMLKEKIDEGENKKKRFRKNSKL